MLHCCGVRLRGFADSCGHDRSNRGVDLAIDALANTRFHSYSSADAIADIGSHAGIDPGTDFGSHAGADPGTDFGSHAGADPGTDFGSDASADPGTHSGTDPGSDADTHASADPGSDADTHAGADPGTHSYSRGGIGVRSAARRSRCPSRQLGWGSQRRRVGFPPALGGEFGFQPDQHRGGLQPEPGGSITGLRRGA